MRLTVIQHAELIPLFSLANLPYVTLCHMNATCRRCKTPFTNIGKKPHPEDSYHITCPNGHPMTWQKWCENSSPAGWLDEIVQAYKQNVLGPDISFSKLLLLFVLMARDGKSFRAACSHMGLIPKNAPTQSLYAWMLTTAAVVKPNLRSNTYLATFQKHSKDPQYDIHHYYDIFDTILDDRHSTSSSSRSSSHDDYYHSEFGPPFYDDYFSDDKEEPSTNCHSNDTNVHDQRTLNQLFTDRKSQLPSSSSSQAQAQAQAPHPSNKPKEQAIQSLEHIFFDVGLHVQNAAFTAIKESLEAVKHKWLQACDIIMNNNKNDTHTAT